MQEDDAARLELKRKLTALDAEFEREMRARGFQPEQVENVPLTAELARLYSERMALAEKLEAWERAWEDSKDE